jgi:predicted ATPase
VFDVLDARAGGLPFLVEELLAGLITRGSLVAQQAGWQLRDERQVDVPMSFAQSISDRLAGLSTRDRRVIDLAAIRGRDFGWSHLPRIVGATEADVLESLVAGGPGAARGRDGRRPVSIPPRADG